MLIGESFIGEGAEAAHINTVLGDRDGPVGIAWTTALATPRLRVVLLVRILRLMAALDLVPVRGASSHLLLRLPSRLRLVLILWMVGMIVVRMPSRTA